MCHMYIRPDIKTKTYLMFAKGLDCQCIGGGRILHEKSQKFIKVYGYSVGFGRADHTKTVEVLKTTFPDYKIEWSNDGY